MGLDTLWRFQFVLPFLALFVTAIVSGPSTLLSHGAWKWSLSMLARGQPVLAARVASLIALALTGVPTVYTLGLVLSFPGAYGTVGLLLVLPLALLALVHAAFRDECILQVSNDPQLAENLGRNDPLERAAWLLDPRGAGLPSFEGATRRQALKRSAVVIALWSAVVGALALRS